MTRTGLGLLVLALLAGAAIGYVAGASGSGSGPAPGDVAGPDTPERPRESYVPAPGVASSGDATLLDLLEAIDGGPAGAAGTGEIAGRIATEDGRPVANVVVRAEKVEEQSRARDLSGAPPEERDLVAEVRDVVRARNRRLAARREAMSDTNGRYTLRGLVDAKYRVSAYLRGYLVSAKPGSRVWNVEPGASIEFIARPLAALPLVVLLPDGSRPERAWIAVMGGPNRARTYEWSAKFPVLHLQPGDYELEATAGEDREMKSESVEVSLEEMEEHAELTLRVETKPGIRGKVTFAAATEFTYAQVTALPLTGDSKVEPDRLLSSRTRAYVHPGRTEYVLADLKPGSWLVGVVLMNQKVVSHRTVEVRGEMIEVDLEVPAPDPEDTLLVRVEAPDGSVERNVRISTGHTQLGGGYSGMRSSAPLEDGSFRVPHFTPVDGRLPDEGSYYVEASSMKYGRKRVEYDRESTPAITIRFDEPGSVIVTLSGYRNTVYESATSISLRSAGGGRDARDEFLPMGAMGSTGRGGLDENGVQKFTPVAPGEYEIEVFIQAKGWSRRSVHRETVTAKGGENRVTVALPPLYSLVVSVPAPEEGQNLRYGLRSFRPEGPSVDGGSPRVEGTRVEFERLPAGEYVFTIMGGRTAERMIVRVPGPAVVRFASQNFSARMVTITDAAGYLAAIGLKDGDLIVGIDGEDFKSAAHMRARWIEARASESSRITVQRSGKRMEFVVDVAKLTGNGAGGRVVDAVR